MTATTLSVLQDRIVLVHDWLIQAGSTLSPEHFAHVFSTDAPPIGWHLWHITRFADRLQAKLATVTNGVGENEFWYQEQLASQWSFVPANLGVLETGMGQRHADAVQLIACAGQAAIVQYARAVFDRCQTATQRLQAHHLERWYFGILDYETDATTGRVWATDPRQSMVMEDLLMHAGHGSRHLGAMEGLRGLLGSAGTISV